MATLRITFEMLEKSISALTKELGNADTASKQIVKEVQGLTSHWEGDTQKMYHQRFTDHKKHIDQFIEHTKEFIEFLKKYKNTMQDQENTQKRLAQGLK